MAVSLVYWWLYLFCILVHVPYGNGIWNFSPNAPWHTSICAEHTFHSQLKRRLYKMYRRSWTQWFNSQHARGRLSLYVWTEVIRRTWSALSGSIQRWELFRSDQNILAVLLRAKSQKNSCTWYFMPKICLGAIHNADRTKRLVLPLYFLQWPKLYAFHVKIFDIHIPYILLLYIYIYWENNYFAELRFSSSSATIGIIILSRDWVNIGGIWIDNWIFEHLQNVTTNNYDSLSELHTPNTTVTRAHLKSSQSSLAVAL
jgi:hypothetical protein